MFGADCRCLAMCLDTFTDSGTILLGSFAGPLNQLGSNSSPSV